MARAEASQMERIAPLDETAILTDIGEIAYAWDAATDTFRYGANAAAVLGQDLVDALADGDGYRALLDPGDAESRVDAILTSQGRDEGEGVPFDCRYSLLPDGADGTRRIIIEDVGRWYGPGADAATHVRGVMRVIDGRSVRAQYLAFHARHDQLTGLFSRTNLLMALNDALVEATKRGQSVGFMVLAVDNFRAINEVYGFEAADQIFASAARRIKAELRENDAIGRIAGNKLGIVLNDCNRVDMRVAAERFRTAVRSKVIADGDAVAAVTVSIGAVNLPRHGHTGAAALAHAHGALQRARELGPDRFVSHEPSAALVGRQRENASLAADVVAALEGDGITLAWQPVVEIATNRPVFHEALPQIARADGTVAKPDAFLPLCSSLGLIRMVERKVLTMATETLRAAPSAFVSVNVSAQTLGDPQWLALLTGALARHPERAARMVVEISEASLVHDIDDESRFSRTLRALGCRLAIDDFGIGHLSFDMMRHLDVDIVKLAGELVSSVADNDRDRSYVEALIALARSRGIRVMADGVADARTVSMLQDWGVVAVQGPLTGEPSEALPWTTSRRDDAA